LARLTVENGDTDLDAIDAAIKAAQAVTDKPTLIKVRTTIGYGSPKAGTQGIHSDALGDAEVKATRENLGWEYEPFVIPEDALNHWRKAIARGKNRREWNQLFTTKRNIPKKLAH